MRRGAIAGTALAALATITGCSKLLGIDELSGPGVPVSDARATGDAPAIDAALPVDGAGDAGDAATDGGFPSSIKISGDVLLIGAATSTCASCTVELVQGDAPIASTMTSATSTFSVSAPTRGLPLDVFLHLPQRPELDALGARVYFPAPLVADRTATINALGSSEIARLSQLAGEPAAFQAGLVIVSVRGSDGLELAGATVQMPQHPDARVHYGDGASDPVPTGSAVATSGDGIAYLFNVSPGSDSVVVARPGTQFRARSITSVVGEVTFVTIAATTAP